MRSRYGQGNGPTRRRTLRENRRIGELVRVTDERDVGVRPGVAEAFGFGDPEGFGDAVDASPVDEQIAKRGTAKPEPRFAMGEPHSDAPPCVHPADRAFAIGLNDAPWPDPITRGHALYALGCAQLGTAGTDRTDWARRVAEGTIRRVLPIALRAAADAHPEEAHRVALRDAADRCETGGAADAVAATVAAVAAYTADADTDAYAAATDAYAAATIAAYAADAATDAADAAAYAARAAVAVAATVAAADAAYGARLHVLTTAVEVALDAYRAEGGA